MNKLHIVLILLVLYVFSSCNRTQKNTEEISEGDSLVIDNGINTSLSSDDFRVNDLEIYSLSSYTKSYNVDEEQIGFISLSDGVFEYSTHPDSLFIPKGVLGKKKLDDYDKSFLKLNGTYRERFLNQKDILESDSVHIFSCQLDSIISYRVKDLDVVASQSPYFDNDRPIAQSDSFIGFEINKKILEALGDNYYNNTFVYVGKENPFVRGKIKPVLWQKVDDKTFPSNIKGFNRKGYEKYPMRTAATFKFEADGMLFLMQQKVFTDKSEDREFEGRHFAVINLKSQTVMYEKSDVIHYEGDGGILYFPDDNITMGSDYFQWTGAIFKNKPPIIYFNDSQPFGCPGIYFLDSNEPPIYILCDNRH